MCEGLFTESIIFAVKSMIWIYRCIHPIEPPPLGKRWVWLASDFKWHLRDDKQTL